MFTDIVSYFAGLFWPNVCACCCTGLLRDEEYICSHCMYGLPATNFHAEAGNPVERMFWGRARIENATAGYFFRKGGKVQNLIHQVKYKGQKEMGAVLGRQMGNTLRNSVFSNIDLIAPVPLHLKKLRKRGYNQSEWIAKGVAEILGKPVDTHTLVRRFVTDSQTRKKRFDRWENVNSGFELSNSDSFAGKHILLIDDVVTTGATLEACIHAVLSAPETKISVAALAYSTV